MDDRFSILFFPKGDSRGKDGKTSIYLRITVNGKRCEISIKRKVDPSKWNSVSGRLNGNSVTSSQIKNQLKVENPSCFCSSVNFDFPDLENYSFHNLMILFVNGVILNMECLILHMPVLLPRA